ncbi:MAG: DUF6776 family protein [Pseudomonadota bacterium]
MEDQPWRRPLAIASAVVIGVGALLLGYVLGQNHVFTTRVSTTTLAGELEHTKGALEKAQAEIADLRLALQVQGEATTALHADMTNLTTANSALEEEVIFYKSLMDPGSLAKGLQVAQFSVIEVDKSAREYGFELLLTQVAVRRNVIRGHVRLDLIGRVDGVEQVLSLTEIATFKDYPVPFRFRYFQDVAGQLQLPDGYEPERILVTATQNGKEAVQSSFDWQPEEAAI